jgi:hypothetical protein
MSRGTAIHLAEVYRVPLGRDFDTLSSSEVACVIDAANAWRYRKPPNANGSRGRYFYAYLNRAAERA